MVGLPWMVIRDWQKIDGENDVVVSPSVKTLGGSWHVVLCAKLVCMRELVGN